MKHAEPTRGPGALGGCERRADAGSGARQPGPPGPGRRQRGRQRVLTSPAPSRSSIGRGWMPSEPKPMLRSPMLHLQENDLDGTLTWAGRAIETAHKQGQPLEEGIGRRFLGQALEQQGELGRALDELQRSAALLTSASNRLELARTWAALAAVENELGQAEASRQHFEIAMAAFRDLGARPDIERMELLNRVRLDPTLRDMKPRRVEDAQTASSHGWTFDAVRGACAPGLERAAAPHPAGQRLGQLHQRQQGRRPGLAGRCALGGHARRIGALGRGPGHLHQVHHGPRVGRE